MDMRNILRAFLIGGMILSACERLETRKEKYPSGKLKAKWEVTVSKKGEFKNGVYEEYWENGNSKSFVNYVDNKEHGLYRSHHENGKVEAEINFEKGLMHGDSKEWYDSGKKKRFGI
jgi:antitoxin component YwqK of YwqJK toxin-antitoxin module